MRMRFFAATAALCLLLGVTAGRADTNHDQAAIAGLMMATFDKPDDRLSVGPVVVRGDHAIAGWAQGEMGGRALLARKQHKWIIVLCSGDALKGADLLVQTGIAAADAAALARDLAEAERGLTPARLALFARFDGVLMIDEESGHGHGNGHDHGHGQGQSHGDGHGAAPAHRH